MIVTIYLVGSGLLHVLPQLILWHPCSLLASRILGSFDTLSPGPESFSVT
jgi:hypothetical protein